MPKHNHHAHGRPYDRAALRRALRRLRRLVMVADVVSVDELADLFQLLDDGLTDLPGGVR